MTSTSQAAVVTGAAQGIGRRVAEVLADEGYALALTGLHDATETLAAVRERGREALEARTSRRIGAQRALTASSGLAT